MFGVPDDVRPVPVGAVAAGPALLGGGRPRRRRLEGGGRAGGRLGVGGDEHDVVDAVPHHPQEALNEQLPLLDRAQAGRPGRVAARVPGRTSVKGDGQISDGASDANQFSCILIENNHIEVKAKSLFGIRVA